MSEEKKFYKLVQDAAAGETPKAPESVEGGKPKIEAPGLLEGFEEDADFESDPDLEARITGKPRAVPGEPATVSPLLPEFVKPGLGDAKHWAIVGCALLVGAMIATGVNAPIGGMNTVYRILLTVYNTVIHAGTGVCAVYVASRLLEHRFGSVELAAGRMFAAVSGLVLVANLHIPIFGANWAKVNELILFLLAIGVYLFAVATLFKLWDRSQLFFVVGFHALFWLIVQLGMALQSVISSVPLKAAAG